MKRWGNRAAAWLVFVFMLALLPFGGIQAFADEPSSEQNEGVPGVVLEVDEVVPLSVNQAKITYSVSNNTSVTLLRTNVIGLYKRSIAKGNFIVSRQMKADVNPGQTVQMTDTVTVTGIGSVPLVLRIFDTGKQYPQVTPSTFPLGDGAGHVANHVVDPTQTVALSDFSVKRVGASVVTVTYTIVNNTPYTVSSRSCISFYKNSPTSANFLSTRVLSKSVPAGTSVTMTDTLIKLNIASERLVARLFDNNSGVLPYLYPSPFPDVVTENKVQYGAAFKTKVICVGDSITYGLLASVNSYPNQLQNKLGSDYAVVNYGVISSAAGTGTSKPYTKTTSYKGALASNPDIVIIMLGTNDSKSYNWTAAHQARFKDTYAQLAQDFLNLPSAPQVYLATPVKVTRANLSGVRETVLSQDIRPMIREVAAELNLPLIENETLLVANQGYYMLDGVHPSSKGYDLLSSNVRDSILAGR
jgi:lysophospholipase L1-like esterase